MVFNFGTGVIYSLYTDESDDEVSYTIPSVSNLSALNAELDTEAGFTVTCAIIQLTADQYGEHAGAEPKIIASNADDSERIALPISGLATATTDAITVARGEVEAEITNNTTTFKK